jgi:RNA polymerase sigma-70 factor, ECF subfamily
VTAQSTGTRVGEDEDVQLVVRLAARDVEAAADLYDRYASQVYALARRVVRSESDAEDVVQDVLMQAWQSAAAYDPRRGSVLAWLLVMTRTRSIDRLRARQSRPSGDNSLLPALAGNETPALDLMLVAEQGDQVREALTSLPPEQRTPLELAYYEGLTQSAIARTLSQPLGTIKTRMRTALHVLRERLRS